MSYDPRTEGFTRSLPQDLSFQDKKGIDLAEPELDSDAATKKYVDDHTSGDSPKFDLLEYVGSFLPKAGIETYAFDGSGRVSTITFTGTPECTISYVYDDLNGGRMDYIEGVFTSPEVATIRKTYNYDGSGNLISITRNCS